LAIHGRIDPKGANLSRLHVLDGDEETRIQIGTIDRKRVDLAHIGITSGSPPICVCHSEVNAAVTIHATLALHAGDPSAAFVDREVVALAGAPSHEHNPPGQYQRLQDGGLGPLAFL